MTLVDFASYFRDRVMVSIHTGASSSATNRCGCRGCKCRGCCCRCRCRCLVGSKDGEAWPTSHIAGADRFAQVMACWGSFGCSGCRNCILCLMKVHVTVALERRYKLFLHDEHNLKR